MDRLTGGLAEDVPERDVDRRGAAHLGAGARKPQVVVQERARMAIDRQRVLADQARRCGFVDVGGDRVRPEKGLAQADQTRVGVHVDPEQVGKLVELDGLDRRDSHGALPPLSRAIIARQTLCESLRAQVA
jgi:hypothetical protein